MGFNRRKIEAQRAAAAEKEAAAKRATEAQIIEDAGRPIAAWNERQSQAHANAVLADDRPRGYPLIHRRFSVSYFIQTLQRGRLKVF